MHGLKVCPDLDTVMYTLGDGIDPERGWGRRDETWSVKDELAAYGVEPTWFGLGDRDLATHLVRTQMLDAGYPLSAGHRGAVPALAARACALLPMTDDRVETHVAIADPEAAERAPGRALPGVLGAAARRGARPRRSSSSGSTDSTPGPGVLEAITDADLVLLPPSNPVVSVGTILGVPRRPRGAARHRGPGRRALPHRRRHATCAAWPSSCSTSIGVEVSAGRRRPALRRPRGRAACSTAGWSTSATPTQRRRRCEAAGLRCRAVPLMMTDHDATAAMAAAAARPGRDR